MSKKMFALITAILGSVSTIACAIITYAQPPYAPAIITAIGIGTTAATEIMQLFVSEDKKSE